MKAKLLGNTEADGANEVLKNATIAVPLKCLSNSWRSREMPLINCKVKLKLKWTTYSVLSAAGANNNDSNSSIIIFTIEDTNLYVPVATLSAKSNQQISKFLSKGFQRSFFGTNVKQKVRIKV